MADPAPPSPEAKPPGKIAEAATQTGAKKASLDWPVLAVLGLLAGAYIGFGGLFSTVALAGAEASGMPFGAARLLSGLAFSLGLVLVLVAGAELFTGNTLLVVAWAEGRADAGDIWKALALAYLTNLVGSVAVAALAFAAGAHAAGDGAVGAAALSTAQAKAALPFGQAFASGVAANILVCLAVWMAWGARSAADKVLVIVPPIAAFVALGLEHSVANMSLIPFGWMVREFADAGGDAEAFAAVTPGGFISNLVPVTLGNMAGGALVGAAYWFSYLRPKAAEADGNRTHRSRHRASPRF